MHTLNCRCCGESFTAKRISAMYCSARCQSRKNKPIPNSCLACNKPLVGRRSDIKYCSTACLWKIIRSDPAKLSAHHEQGRQYRKRNRESIRERQNAAYDREKQSARGKIYYADNKAKINAKHQGNYHVLRNAAISEYGGKCSCCGESQWQFLTIDHVNGGGSKHRKEIGHGAATFRWLKRMGYPTGFQVLCFNCNCAKWAHGVCPHQLVHN